MAEKIKFDFKDFFFFVISLGSLVLLLFVLFEEIKVLKNNIEKKEDIVELKNIVPVKEPVDVVQKTYTAVIEKKKSTLSKEKEIVIRIGVFKLKENADRIISVLKKHKFDYKVVHKGNIKVYVIAKNELEKNKLFDLLKKHRIKPVITNKIGD
jgi:hypothetical protein